MPFSRAWCQVPGCGAEFYRLHPNEAILALGVHIEDVHERPSKQKALCLCVNEHVRTCARAHNRRKEDA